MRDWSRIKKVIAELFYLLRGERAPSLWWAKVHGTNKAGKKITLTLYRPMQIDQIANMPGMEEFMSVSDFEYRDWSERDSVFGAQDDMRVKKMPTYFGSGPEMKLPYPIEERHFIDKLGIDPSRATESLLEQVKQPKYGWDDPEYGAIFKKIDMYRAREEKKKGRKK